MTSQKIAFIDRDGTLIYEPQDTYQVDNIEKLRILPGVIAGLQALRARSYKLIMVTNQDGLDTAAFPKAAFEVPHQKMLEIFKREGIIFDRILICPHLPEENCLCRKPKTGLLQGLLVRTKLNPASFVCGDRESDRQFANNLGVSFLPMQTNGDFYKAIKPVMGSKP